MIASQLDMKKDSVWKIITEDLGMWKVCTKMLPRLLNDDQKERRMQVCQNIIEYLQNEPDLLRRVITSHETWTFEYDPEIKCQSSQWKSPMSRGQRKQDSQSQKSKSC